MTQSNHLINEPSPYLQQHAHNPVDWYPWGKDALAKAQQENKPILLSIGYAACHWCHVMAHESFEDQETAELMNKLFVNIKVDKEERPDLDKIYQTSHYFLSQQNGGWPLTIFLSPDLTPFFSGTYFPREEHHQLPSFKRILRLIAELYQNKAPEIKEQNQELRRILQQQQKASHGVDLNEKPLQLALTQLQQNYDENYGGFGTAPKFPQASKLEYLLRNKSPMALSTLRHIAKGGIYDQLAGGFYRYSVDEQWNIPHFEKMLYDNAQLLTLYLLAGQQFQEPYFYDIAQETAAWILDQLQAPEGGYFSSFDADSEGEEGKFYRWTPKEVRDLLSPEEYELIRLYFGLDQNPNFENHWHFYIAHSLEETAQFLKINPEKAKQSLLTAKRKLLNARNQRIPPFRDEKILTSWNGLMIKGLLLAGAALNEERFTVSAQKTLQLIQQKLWKDGYLLASYKESKAYLSAYLDDYAFLLDALLTSLQLSWDSKQLQFAIAITERILASFQDKKSGGFFFTPENHEALLYRPKTMMDEAIPAGNGVIVRALLILGHLLGESRYLVAAEKTLQAAWPILMQYPAEHCSLLLGLKEYLNPSQIIVIRGDKKEIINWQTESKTLNNYVFAIPADASELPESLALKKAQGNSCAYVCQGLQCEAAVTDKNQLKALVKE
ncbi:MULTISPECIES: thioredoxin domain-containing protein [Legionella]|uniref:Spermatogenesis-associated protein 20-like TRX domain-containing protein n=1 Tax=Legionella drozanskii LLAP-1 TaxID=1212489 RepID=A0A0W0SVV3_9GAMM|nr:MULTISPECIES: thioredoxin domain-containing protein [Legionella]KTC87519.1 hypothetical protein Ldro_1138 [Legionella drozanskii LLAP-1]PJE10447.1 MAG: thioredoxin domain-containing protein [Legionella sp.]